MVANTQKDIIVKKLKERGSRITKQRLMLLDIILEENCSSCKEIFYKASKIDKNIGSATVYRMINTLEEMGAINRKNMYRIACGEECSVQMACRVDLEGGDRIELSASEWNKVVQAGLEQCGFLHGQKIQSVEVMPCACEEAQGGFLTNMEIKMAD